MEVSLMKKYTAYKTIQLVLFIVLAAAAIFIIFPNAGVYHQVATDQVMKTLATVLWCVLGVSFLFILVDFLFSFNISKEVKKMEYALHAHPVSGITNRFSCDSLIEQYLGKPLPDGLGIIIFDLTNIININNLYGHLRGNEAIVDFSNILRMASQDLCFVGRNGGNRFLAVFENSSEEDMQKLLDRIDQKVATYNSNPDNCQIEYAYGKALSSANKGQVKDISQLISLATSRIGD